LKKVAQEPLFGYVKKKVGRPFKGVVEDLSKEPNVPERRSILRGFKKFFSKKEYERLSVKSGKKLVYEMTVGLPED
jgi:hypothetical protein